VGDRVRFTSWDLSAPTRVPRFFSFFRAHCFSLPSVPPTVLVFEVRVRFLSLELQSCGLVWRQSVFLGRLPRFAIRIGLPPLVFPMLPFFFRRLFSRCPIPPLHIARTQPFLGSPGASGWNRFRTGFPDLLLRPPRCALWVPPILSPGRKALPGQGAGLQLRRPVHQRIFPSKPGVIPRTPKTGLVVPRGDWTVVDLQPQGVGPRGSFPTATRQSESVPFSFLIIRFRSFLFPLHWRFFDTLISRVFFSTRPGLA